jgi:hypothetical protein
VPDICDISHNKVHRKDGRFLTLSFRGTPNSSLVKKESAELLLSTTMPMGVGRLHEPMNTTRCVSAASERRFSPGFGGLSVLFLEAEAILGKSMNTFSETEPQHVSFSKQILNAISLRICQPM